MNPLQETAKRADRQDQDLESHEATGIKLPLGSSGRYSPDRDPASEKDIARYVEIEAHGETVQHAELVKSEFVLGDKYEMWDVITDQDRWWVITNLTNLYSQRYFPSLDYTFSFHIGLMMRIRSRPAGPESDDPSPFDEVFRRQEQAKDRLDYAIEPEDYQAVGMQLRECLISLVAAVKRKTVIPAGIEHPQEANVEGWSEVLLNLLCPGSTNEKLRRYMKGMTKDSWQLVNWLTHYRGAADTVSSIAVHGCDTVVGHFIQLVERANSRDHAQCPLCSSRNIRTHYAPEMGDDGEYYQTCGACEWSTYEEPIEQVEGPESPE